MTENEMQAILVGILSCWQSLEPAEVKSLMRILIAHGILPRCAACGEPIMTIQDFSLDHLIARSKGGPDLVGNVAPMHVGCNVEKGDEIDDKYFCYIEPELLQKMLKDKSKKKRRHSEKTKDEYTKGCNKRSKNKNWGYGR